MTHILQDPFTPQLPEKGVREIGQKSSNILRTRGAGLKTTWTLMNLSKLESVSVQNPGNITPPQVRFPFAGIYLEKSESIVHQRKILPTSVIGHTLRNHLPTSYPTFQTHLAGSFQYTWDENNYRDQKREAKQNGERRQEKKRERERRAANSINSWSSPA